MKAFFPETCPKYPRSVMRTGDGIPAGRVADGQEHGGDEPAQQDSRGRPNRMAIGVMPPVCVRPERIREACSRGRPSPHPQGKETVMTDQEPGAQLTESYEPQSYAPQENMRPEIATVAFGGYRTEDVDRLVDQYEERTAGYRRSLARQIAIADNLRNLNTRLTAQLEAACRERDELRHRAESPFEAAGKAAQDLVDNARNTARDTIAEARAQAKGILDEANAKAGDIVESAKQTADGLAEEHKREHDKAMADLAEQRDASKKEHAKALADIETRRRDAQAATAERERRAGEREQRARETVDAIRETLKNAIRTLDD